MRVTTWMGLVQGLAAAVAVAVAALGAATDAVSAWVVLGFAGALALGAAAMAVAGLVAATGNSTLRCTRCGRGLDEGPEVGFCTACGAEDPLPPAGPA